MKKLIFWMAVILIVSLGVFWFFYALAGAGAFGKDAKGLPISAALLTTTIFCFVVAVLVGFWPLPAKQCEVISFLIIYAAASLALVLTIAVKQTNLSGTIISTCSAFLICSLLFLKFSVRKLEEKKWQKITAIALQPVLFWIGVYSIVHLFIFFKK